jgi:hypothetical protein
MAFTFVLVASDPAPRSARAVPLVRRQAPNAGLRPDRPCSVAITPRRPGS